MKRWIVLLIALCMLLPCALAGEAVMTETEISPRLIEGNYHWVFDVSFVNDTDQPLTIVSVEVLDRFSQGDVCSWHKTGTQLVEERYAERVRLESGESFSLYLTTQQLAMAEEKRMIITARTDDFQPVCQVFSFHLLEAEKYVQPEPQQAPETQSISNAVPVHPVQSGAEMIWQFEMRHPNDSGETLRVEQLEVFDYLNGEETGGACLFPEQLGLEHVRVAPGEEFVFNDSHPVVDFFDSRLYRFTFIGDSGQRYVQDTLFELYPAEGQQPNNPGPAPATFVSEDGVLHPDFDGQTYFWHFPFAIPNDTDSTLTLVQMDVVHILDGVDMDVFNIPAEQMPTGPAQMAPGEVFAFGDNHPVVPDFNACRYTFVFTDENGEKVVREFYFELSPDPLPAEPAIDYAADAGFDLSRLRHDADFCVEVAPGVSWVPAVMLGQSAYSNQQIYQMRTLSPEDKQAEIHTLYEALQLYQISGFAAADDNVRISENGVNWEHHKPGYYAVLTNEGCCATDSNWLNYILQNDYPEVGFMATSQRDGSGHIFNYILYDGWYYFIDLTKYRAADSECALESGDLNHYYQTDFVLGNIHRAASPEAFAQYIQQAFNDPPGLIFLYTAPDCLALDGVQEPNGITILYGIHENQVVNVVFDDAGDSLYPGFTDAPTQNFDWASLPAYPFS